MAPRRPPPPDFYPGCTKVFGRGEYPKDTRRYPMIKPGPNYCVGSGTAADPIIYYMYEVDACAWLTPERRPYFEEELQNLAIKSNMKCVIVRSPGFHNRMNMRDATGTLVTTQLENGHCVIQTVPAEWHITIYMGESFENIYVQGHVFTCVGPNPYGNDPPKILKIMDDPKNQRRDRVDCSMEFWLASYNIQHLNSGRV